MKKSDKKIETALCDALTGVCDDALDTVPGFKWLTHFVNYHRFPESLLVLCIFDTNAALSEAIINHQDDGLRHLIKEQLSCLGITIRNPKLHVDFDTEENCTDEHNGKWPERFRTRAI
jgi:hypothetical protein